MGLFIPSKSVANRHAVYAIEVPPPAAIKAIGTGVAALVGQFPWGPDQALTEAASYKDATNMFAPPASNRLSTGYLAMSGKGWPSLRIVRVLGPTAAKASIALTAAGPTTIVTAQGKYKGTFGNSIVCTVSAASDGDANHFDLKVEATGASGTSTDTFKNLNYSGTGADSAPDFTNSLLLGALTKSNSGRPTNGTYTMAGGTDGTITSAEYVGTAGAPDKGISLLETDKKIGGFCVDDCSNALRAAVNAGIKAHADLMQDRIGFMNGNSGLSISAVRTDVASYRSTNVVYTDVWYYKYDDVTGAKQLIPPSALAMSVTAQVSPSTSPAWKAREVQAMTREVVSLETERGDAAGGNSDAGIMTLIREEEGGFTFEAGYVTYAAVDTSRRSIVRTRMGIYIAKSVVKSLREFIDSPNVEENQQAVIGAIDGFLDSLKKAQKRDPNHTPHIVDYRILPLSETNTAAELAAGDFTVQADIKTPSGIERLFFPVRFGETVQLAAA